MTPKRRRKCCNCQQLYEPDPRSRRRQKYCSQPACKKASKAASQQRWRASAKGRDYFHGSANVLRVREWRKAHPGYWRKAPRPPGALQGALQDHSPPQTLVPPKDAAILSPSALQEMIQTQSLLLTGLVVHLTGDALQENIALTTRRLIALGQQLQGSPLQGSQLQGPIAQRPGHGGDQTSVMPAAIAESSLPVQLDRPSSGAG
jgi:hypothetical protein